VPSRVDGAFMLDMMHFLSDAQLHATLSGLHDRMAPGARLVIRSVMVPTRRFNFFWWLEKLKLKMGGPATVYRTTEQIESILERVGFTVQKVQPSGPHGELVWFKSVKVERAPMPPHADESHAMRI
jgi:cyclopropane fatty-acyl-phospholipid synthase-like methyltransferase